MIKKKAVCLEDNSKGEVGHYRAPSQDNAVVKTFL